MSDEFDVIVVGAGMAGCAAAIRLAKGGSRVLLLERGEAAGAKNLSGGILWGNDLARVLPAWREEMPLERHVVRKRFGFLTGDGALSFDFEDAGWRKPPYVASPSCGRGRTPGSRGRPRRPAPRSSPACRSSVSPGRGRPSAGWSRAARRWGPR